MNILFVCSGNVFRSASAQLILQRLLGESEHTVWSAGTNVNNERQEEMDPETIRSLEYIGIQQYEWNQNHIEQMHIDWADRIICMADKHKVYIKEHFGVDADLFMQLTWGDTLDVVDSTPTTTPTDEIYDCYHRTMICFLLVSMPRLIKELNL